MNRGGIVWLTGIPASGKSTIAGLVAHRILMSGGRAEVLDGDEVRETISKGLSFTREGRRENVRRIGWLARKLAKNDVWVFVAAVSPYREDREEMKAAATAENIYFLEVHTRCPLSVAQRRDPKGLYKKAAEGELRNLTGVDAPYEETPDVFALDTCEDTPEESARRLWDVILWRPEENPPIVCIGRGHTGTRLVSKLMQDLGVYIGQDEQINGCEDSLEWVPLIYKMVEEIGPTAELPKGSTYKSDIRNTARIMLKNGHVIPGTPWGWKLPETMLVLPLFVDAFPQIKLIHCIRHPVSSTLRNFHGTSNPSTALGRAAVGGAYAYCGRDSTRISDDEDWYRSALTWEHQTGRAMKFGRSMKVGRYLEIKYEDMCASPEWAFSALHRFTNLNRLRKRASIEINPDRMNKWDKTDPRAERIWEICGKTAQELGYTFLEGCA